MFTVIAKDEAGAAFSLKLVSHLVRRVRDIGADSTREPSTVGQANATLLRNEFARIRTEGRAEKVRGELPGRFLEKITSHRVASSQVLSGRLDTYPYEDEFGEFANYLYALCIVNRDREAIAESLDYFDDRLTARRFRECDRAFRQLQTGKLASSVLVSILGITVRAKALKARGSFYERAFEEISKRKGKKYAR